MNNHNCKNTLCVTPHYEEPIDSGFTDEDVPIRCGECSPDTYVEGVGAMVAHILKLHKNYTPDEAKKYADAWKETAYQELEGGNR